jgi:hypothetical protein
VRKIKTALPCLPILQGKGRFELEISFSTPFCSSSSSPPASENHDPLTRSYPESCPSFTISPSETPSHSISPNSNVLTIPSPNLASRAHLFWCPTGSPCGVIQNDSCSIQTAFAMETDRTDAWRRRGKKVALEGSRAICIHSQLSGKTQQSQTNLRSTRESKHLRLLPID